MGITQDEVITSLAALGEVLKQGGDEQEAIIQQAFVRNNWFIPEFNRLAISNIAENYLNKEKLEKWVSAYTFPHFAKNPKAVGIIMAGNIPLVGVHDLISVLVSGHKAVVKLSSKDEVLPTYLLKELIAINPSLSSQIELVEKLSDTEAVIATGSNNTHRYFEYYFGQYPNVLRKNRNGVAVLTGEEDGAMLDKLADDVFLFFGLGCRNVSKVYIPQDFDIQRLMEAWQRYDWLKDHNKYKNNYDYNRTLLLMNQIPHEANEFVMLTASEVIGSRIAALHYERYEDIGAVRSGLVKQKDAIQVVVGDSDLIREAIPPGTAQQPALWDYADGVDVLQFLQEL